MLGAQINFLPLITPTIRQISNRSINNLVKASEIMATILLISIN